MPLDITLTYTTRAGTPELLAFSSVHKAERCLEYIISNQEAGTGEITIDVPQPDGTTHRRRYATTLESGIVRPLPSVVLVEA